MYRKFFRYVWGMIIHPIATLYELAKESSIRYAVMLAVLGLGLTLLNLLLFTIFGYDWLVRAAN
jgi:hypothetical protein